MNEIYSRLDWNLLRTFISIVQEKSISRAAERLHLSQPAVSLALKRLEETLNQKLISRNYNEFLVTTTGEIVYREALAISGGIHRMSMNLMNVTNDLKGKIRLGMVSGVTSNLFDKIMTEFHQKYPRVTFEITSGSTEDIHNALLHYDISLGICLKQKTDPFLSDRLFLRQTYYLYCGRPHPLFGKNNISLESLKNEAFVSFNSAQLDGVMSPVALFRSLSDLHGEVVGVSSSIDEIKRMISAGLGIGALPSHLMEFAEQNGELWRLPPNHGIADINLYLMWHQAPRFGQAESVFNDMLQSALTESR